MRVAIDTRAWRPPLTGIGHFAHRLIGSMLPLLSADEELLSFNGWSIAALDPCFLDRVEARNAEQESENAPPFIRSAGKKVYVFMRRIGPVRKGVRWLQARSFHGAEKHFDVFHAVNYVPPGTFHKPILPFIHDLSHMRYPTMHPRERVEWLQAQLKLIADVPYVQTNSQFSKSEIVAVLGVPANRIYVTYAAPEARFRPERDRDESVLAKYRLAERSYFLAVGTREPRKNFKTVAEAYTALPLPQQRQFRLIWVGPAGWGDLSLSSAAQRAKDLGLIRMIGYLSDRELAVLYRNTALFVMPSIYEGFGMPVVEAMACGARIALSRIPVFEEIAGSYARYIEPMDVAGWRQAFKDTIEEDRGATAASAPPPDLSKFSWRSSAATTLELYRCLGIRPKELTRPLKPRADNRPGPNDSA